MTVWFRIRRNVIFVCYKKPFMTVSKQYIFREIPKRNAFLLVAIWNLNTESKCQKLRHMAELKHFGKLCQFLDNGSEI